MLDIKWILLILVISQVFLYAARVPMHRALRSIGEALAGGLALAGVWFKKLAGEMTKRSGELVLDSGREGAGVKIEREFRRIEGTFSRDLAEFPKLYRKLDDLVTQAESDYQECGTSPPQSPEWNDVVNAVSNLPSAGDDRVIHKFVDEIRKSVLDSEKKARQEYRETTSKRHKILAGMATQWGEIRKVLQRTSKSAELAVESTSRIDGYMERYEGIIREEKGTNRVLTWVTMRIFIISGLVMAIALGGAFINFQLIALPMSELVPAGGRLMGLPVPSIAALVLVLMEIAAGIFVLEMLGITNLFPQLDSLSSGKRRGILGVAFFGLLLLASIESSLAVLREQIVEAESLLKQSLAGATEVGVVQPISSNIPLIGQAVLGFTLPWILAMIAIPLEMLINTAGPMFLLIFSVVAVIVGQICRLLSHATYHLTQAITSIYDVYIVIPLRIEGALHRDRDVFRAEEEPAPVSYISQFEPMPAEITRENMISEDAMRDPSRDETRETEVMS